MSSQADGNQKNEAKSLPSHIVMEENLNEAAFIEKCKAVEKVASEHSIISFADARGKITYVNDLFCAISKYSREELIGKDHALLNSGYHPKGFFGDMYRTVIKGQTWKAEIRNRAKDGSYYWVATTIIPVFNAEGKIHQYVSARTDITQQKLKNIDFGGQIDAINKAQAVVEFNLDGILIDANENFLKAFDYTLDEIKGKHHSMLVEPSYRQSLEYKLFWDKLNRGEHEQGEYKRIGKNGKEVWILELCSPIFDLSGKPIRVVKYATDITEQKIKNSDYLGQIVAINKSQAVMEYSMNGTILTGNDNFLSSLGYSLEEIKGRHHSILVDPTFKDTLEYRYFWDKLNRGEFESAEYKRIGKNGREVWILAAYNPIFNLDGKPFKVVEYATDITKQKLEIEKNGERIKSEMSKALNDLDLQNKLKVSIEELSNSIRGELSITDLGNNLLKKIAQLIDVHVGLFYFANRDRLELIASYAYRERKSLSNVFKVGEGLVGQCALEKKTIIISNVPDDYIKINSGLGETTPSVIMVMPISFENKLLGVLEIGKFGNFTNHDIKFLENSIETIGITFNSALSRDQLNKLLDDSKLQSERLQTQQEELRCSNEELQNQQERLKQTNEELTRQSEILRKSEEKIKIKNDELKDKTESLEKQAQEIEIARNEIETKAKALEVASKYKSEFLANMSHELRTPLNSLLILSKTLADNEEGNLKPDQIEAASVIHSGGKDLLNLINDILDLSKVEAGKLQIHIENIPAKSIGANLKKQFDPIAKNKGLKFIEEYELGLEDALIKTDSSRTEQILKNFLSNAFKFTAAGEVKIRVHRPDASTKFTHSHLNTNNCIAFSIIDSGIGIPDDKQELIFEAFHQGDGSTSRKYGGTGLGLSISRELSKLLSAEIQMKSKVNMGSTFTLYIPMQSSYNDLKPSFEEKKTTVVFASEVKKEESLILNRPLIQDDRNNISAHDSVLLIIEDDLVFAKILMNQAKKRGHKCLIAETGKEGLALAEKYTIGGITLDLILPDMDGRSVLESLKTNPITAHIPVHVISADDDQHLSLQKGALGHLTKPASTIELDNLLNRIAKNNQKAVKKVLVIEDSEGERDNLVKLIQGKEIIVTVAKNGGEALHYLKDRYFDCMILDLTLPDTSGLNLLKELHSLNILQLPPVIIYSAKDLDKEEYKELREYTSSFIVKGLDSETRILDELHLFLHSIKPIDSSPSQDISKVTFNEVNFSYKDKKVLIVDDDMRNIFALSTLLRKQGMKVIMAENGKEAIEKLENESDVDLVIMDIMMPVMDGYEAIQIIKNNPKYQKLPIIALTAKTLPEDKAKALEAGANDFLTKPVEMDKLLNLIKVWLSKTVAA